MENGMIYQQSTKTVFDVPSGPPKIGSLRVQYNTWADTGAMTRTIIDRYTGEVLSTKIVREPARGPLAAEMGI